MKIPNTVTRCLTHRAPSVSRASHLPHIPLGKAGPLKGWPSSVNHRGTDKSLWQPCSLGHLGLRPGGRSQVVPTTYGRPRPEQDGRWLAPRRMLSPKSSNSNVSTAFGASLLQASAHHISHVVLGKWLLFSESEKPYLQHYCEGSWGNQGSETPNNQHCGPPCGEPALLSHT